MAEPKESVSMRLSKGLMTDLRERADKHMRSISGETEMLIREGLKAEIEWARKHVALKKKEADFGGAEESDIPD